ncbi:MAG: ATP-binding cassette domain-containing protein [Ignavibacteria bacterium]|jgi:cell division transport system ATP-binding protein
MIRINNLKFSYDTKEIFNDLNIEIMKGDFTFLVGESGIGKSTLLKLLYFELLPKSGYVRFDDYDSSTVDKKEIPLLRRKIGIVFQDFKLLNDRNVFENIATPLYITLNKKEVVKKKVYDIASKLGLINYLKEMPYDLSGGEQQRVAIARAIINEPSLLIADEPTGNLDPFISNEIIKLLIDINIQGTTVFVATHNFEIVRRFSDRRILQIKDNKVFDVRVKI